LREERFLETLLFPSEAAERRVREIVFVLFIYERRGL